MNNNPLISVINNAKRRRFIKRGLALLCALVLVFTMNTLKRDANTLERIPMCGYAGEHVHTPDCYDGDTLVCGLAVTVSGALSTSRAPSCTANVASKFALPLANWSAARPIW